VIHRATRLDNTSTGLGRLFSGQFATNFFGEIAFHPHTILGNIFQSAWPLLQMALHLYANVRAGAAGYNWLR
jgi:hypothetical protein